MHRIKYAVSTFESYRNLKNAAFYTRPALRGISHFYHKIIHNTFECVKSKLTTLLTLDTTNRVSV